MAKITTITNPLTGQPAQVDQLEHTAQQIDDAIARSLPGGAIDIALSKKQFYIANGVLVNSNGGNIKGIGTATVQIDTNGIAKIDFAFKITENDTSVSTPQWGIAPPLLTAINANIPNIMPYSGGWLLMLDENGGYKSENGYGAYMTNAYEKWAPARVYNDNGAVGPWGTSVFPVGSRFIGTCYGYA